jgi:hypothetical protein
MGFRLVMLGSAVSDAGTLALGSTGFMAPSPVVEVATVHGGRQVVGTVTAATHLVIAGWQVVGAGVHFGGAGGHFGATGGQHVSHVFWQMVVVTLHAGDGHGFGAGQGHAGLAHVQVVIGFWHVLHTGAAGAFWQVVHTGAAGGLQVEHVLQGAAVLAVCWHVWQVGAAQPIPMQENAPSSSHV